jgi:acetyl-CoA C-acetyltransferase
MDLFSMAYILQAKRTPVGAFQGQFKKTSATDLGSAALKAAWQGASYTIEALQGVMMGNVLSAGLGQAPARQASLGAGLPSSIPTTTLNKVCGSAMEAVILASKLVHADSPLMLAGGMESMTHAPYLLPKARGGFRLGHGKVVDHTFFDGLEDPYHKNTLMGVFAEKTAQKYGFTRHDQDAFVKETVKRAKNALSAGHFDDEYAYMEDAEGRQIKDEPPLKVKEEKISLLKGAFDAENGTVTAASSSSIADGAAALLIADEGYVMDHGLKPLAKIIATSHHAQDPEWFTIAPVGAIQKVLKQARWTIEEVDAFEINEAFACVTMAAMKDLSIPHEKVNLFGGACALGHPLGASGARILVTLLNVLRKNKGRKGIATACIGGGEATAIAVELMDL